jgi:diacylglycerol kinase (ATP)
MNLLHKKNRNRWLFIVNSVAGRGKTGRVLSDLVTELNNLGFDYQIEVTKAPLHAIEITREYVKKGFRKIVAVGGDGTVNEVVNGIMKSKKADEIQFGVIPEGGGNDFARNLHLDSNIKSCLEVLLRGKTKDVDVGRIEDNYFINALGIGFDAEAAENSKAIKFLNGLPRYILAVLKTLLKLKARNIQIEINGEVIERSILLVSIGNGISAGSGFLLTPNAIIDDGLYDICIIRALPVLRIFKLLPTAIKGEHIGYPEVEIKRADHIKIKADYPIPVYYDGEIPELKNPLELEIELLSQKLQTFYKKCEK